MSVLWWVVTLVVLVVGWTAWRLVRYPGRWAHAFHEAHRKDRRALDDARSAVRKLRNAARRETWRAWGKVKRAESAHRRRVRQAEAELERRRAPDRGDRVHQLGAITLYEHAVVVSEDELPLAGLHVRIELARAEHVSYVYLTHPDGQDRMQSYEGEEFPEDTVRKFSVQLHNAAVAAHRSRGSREDDIAALEAALREAQEATGPVEAARERLDETRARHSADPRLPRARAALDDARTQWQDLTGRRPL
ncbi:hypothetical protein OG599_02665 [Streptomyces sp. NBC_01335]|uniref:hypothetical protein n=1 Tax=Streptomyces sp. NBC_01335 TaxID=2903828 RepID=UPI002E15AF6A|nr:hypothetical protein OG599_02665 [Streptomyces sp. NBC_01335]